MRSMTLGGRTICLLRAGERGFLVKSGEVLVALQPYRDNKPLRRLHLGTAKIGDYIPAPAAPVIGDETGETVTAVYLLSSIAPAVIEEVRDREEWTET
ncbi:MAG: hypothetical protein II868_03970, partial [Butyrivibrio sp.]|nr:hypothetical protein [Butyrivibrio sp.]